MELTEFGEAKLPSIVKDPFAKTHIKGVTVVFSENIFKAGEYSAMGWVEFRNGKTTGKQNFDGATFDEVVLKIKAMLEGME